MNKHDFSYNPPDTAPEIIYQDDHIVVLNKPSGLLHVPGRDPRLWDCLDLRVRQILPTASVIHRLDCDTSGVVVMGLNKRAHAAIAMQFEKRTAKKTYIARVWGDVKGDSGTIDLPLAGDPERKPRHRVDPVNGRSAQTDWEVMEREGGTTLMRLFPHTGRTHQLRVHMLSLGHVIIGDRLYAQNEALEAAERLQLHASLLGFIHPETGQETIFTASLPF